MSAILEYLKDLMVLIGVLGFFAILAGALDRRPWVRAIPPSVAHGRPGAEPLR
jgi:hypothetical protein